MKTVQINKVKVRIFEESELREKLGMDKNDVELVLKHQRTFPELLQDENKGFINSARKLYLELGLNESQWSRWSKKNIIESKFFNENEDWQVLDTESTTSKGGQMAKDYRVTIEMAKHLCMKVDNISGHNFRQYFIIIEKTLRDYERWCEVREPEKKNANKLKLELKKWGLKNFSNCDESGLYAREFNMINKNLTSLTALEIKLNLGYKDKQTREHLTIEVNKAIDFLQEFDINLLTCGMDFETRNKMIKQICETNYNYIKEYFNHNNTKDTVNY